MFRGTLRSPAPQSLKLCPAIGTVDGLAGFLHIIFISGRHHMLAKHIAAGLVGSALLATVAFAQTPTATTDRANMPPAAASDSSSFQGNWRASKVVGLSVYNDNNESLGSINDLLMDKDGNIRGWCWASAASSASASTNTAPAAAATVKANPWYPDHAVYNATKDQLKAMPEFKYAI